MKYKYTAIDQHTGVKVVNTSKAESVSVLIADLKTQGLMSLKVTPVSSSKFAFLEKIGLNSNRISSKELMIFTRQLAATLKAGLLLTECLETVSENLDHQYLSVVINQLQKDIVGGSDFSSALSKFPEVFPKTYIAIIRSGEAMGTLANTLDQLAVYLEDSEKLKDKIITATRYPMFVFGFAFTVVAVMVLFLVPKFASMFEHAHQELPLLTKIVVGVSSFSIHYFYLFIAFAVLLWAGFWYAMKFPAVHGKVDELKLKIPILGKEIYHKALLSRFCRTLGFLMQGGIALSKALDITADVVGHHTMADAISKVRQRVVGGSQISTELRKFPIFPNFVSKMISVGERTGNISQMMHKTADYYDHEIDHTLSRLTALLEPVLIIFIGGMVLIVVLALYLPIFHMSSTIR
jgi:type IV pilus assembly protein PilC